MEKEGGEEEEEAAVRILSQRPLQRRQQSG